MGKRKRRRKSRLPFDLGRNPIGVFLSILTLVLTLVALVLETGLSWTCVGVSIAATAGWKAFDDRRQKKLPKAQKRPEPTAAPPPKREPPKEPGRPRTAKPGVKCLRTGKDTKLCDCASRHITSVPNQYKKPLGCPYGVNKDGTPCKFDPHKGKPKPEPAETGGGA